MKTTPPCAGQPMFGFVLHALPSSSLQDTVAPHGAAGVAYQMREVAGSTRSQGLSEPCVEIEPSSGTTFCQVLPWFRDRARTDGSTKVLTPSGFCSMDAKNT